MAQTNASPLDCGKTLNGTQWVAQGSGLPVVLIHGVGMHYKVWAPQIAGLADVCRVISYDMLGHGESPLPPEQATLADFSTQLHELVESLELGEIVLVGHSMGSLVALEYALRHPRNVRGVIALNAVDQRTPEQKVAVRARAERLESEGVASSLEDTLDRWFGHAESDAFDGICQQVREWLLAADPVGYPRAYRVFANADDELSERVTELVPPALFATGELDPNSTPRMSEQLAERAQQGRSIIVPGARHMMTMEMPHRINRMIRAFIAEQGEIAPREDARAGGGVT